VLNHWHLTKIYGKKNESVVTPSGNSGHVVVPKAWIGKEAIVVLKETQSKGKGKGKKK
jgi:putative transposon-encoded protein